MKLYYFNHIFNKNKEKETIHKTLNDISEEIDCKESYDSWYNCIKSIHNLKKAYRIDVELDCEIFKKKYLTCVNTTCKNINK